MASLARNAIWNIVAGMSAAIVSVALPPFLARLISAESFSAWALALQIASYVNLLNFGLQVIVGRQVAQAHATGDVAMRDRVVTTAFVALGLAGAVGVAVLFGLIARLDWLLPDSPAALRLQIGHTILLLAIAFAVQLPTSVLGAVFIGLQRNVMYANGMMATRLLTFLSVVAVASATASIVAMGLAWLAASLAGAALIAMLWWRHSPSPRLHPRAFTTSTLVVLARDSVAFTVWNFAMLLVSGLQLLIVARLDYAEVGAFAVASSIGLFVSGVMQAVCSTLVPHAAHYIALGEQDKVVRTLKDLTMAAMLLSSGMTAVLVVGSGFIMQLWLGKLSTDGSASILALLTVAQFIRNWMLAYVMTAIALGLQKKMIVTPLVEGATAFTAALLLGEHYGAAGVALGMCAGSLVGVSLAIAQNVVGKSLSAFNLRSYAAKDIIGPSLGCIVVSAMFFMTGENNHANVCYIATLMIVFIFVTAVFCHGRIRHLSQTFLTRGYVKSEKSIS